ncbi:hypothetical protein [Corynebacterium frankenforstense]|uniref:hypothetical protein n=1 Tax=Corynebacterium frankenforstense TaxID=1230998 RepID=UPI000952BBC5|nr:hypothetical protein [Corynebacterium frankenforstense]
MSPSPAGVRHRIDDDTVVDLAAARRERSRGPRDDPAARTVVLRVAGAERQGEVYRHIGVNDHLHLFDLHQILDVCLGFDTPEATGDGTVAWWFGPAAGAGIDAPGGRYDGPGRGGGVGRGDRGTGGGAGPGADEELHGDDELHLHLAEEGDEVTYHWGLWAVPVTVVGGFPRDAATPDALCVGGYGSFTGAPFDLPGINARLTGAETITDVLAAVHPQVRGLISRSGLFDFVPLLQALDLTAAVSSRPERIDADGIDADGIDDVPPGARARTGAAPGVGAGADQGAHPGAAELVPLAELPLEDDQRGADAFWATVLALTCLSDEELTDEVITTTMAALGWTAADGGNLGADEVRDLCRASLEQLAAHGGYGPDRLPPVGRLDLYRALLAGGTAPVD